MEENRSYIKGFIPYALAAFLVSVVGGFSAVLGPAFVQDMRIAYNNTTWTALAQAMSTAACAPILGKLGDVLGRRITLLGGIIVFALGNALAALISLIGLIAAERRAVHPILPGSFMRRRVFILSVLALTLTQGLMQANMTNTIVFVNYTQPENSVISAYAISVMYLGISLGAVFIGPLADRFEPRVVLSGSLLLMSALGLLGFGLGGNGTIFMKVALSDLPGDKAGAATGTYGLFRDLAAPFGVAVLVPLFTNQITGSMNQGMAGADAAVQAIHSLSIIEIVCAAAGIAVVLMLPRIHQERRNQYAS